MQDTMALAASYQEAVTACAHAGLALAEANAAQKTAYKLHEVAAQRVRDTRAQFETAVNQNAFETAVNQNAKEASA